MYLNMLIKIHIYDGDVWLPYMYSYVGENLN